MARILVIEDNRDNRELMQYLLGAFGHVAISAGDGESGIETARRERPDLVLCDIHLPGADGYEVVRELRTDRTLDSMPVIAVTALAMLGDREKGIAAGFDGYIAKPIDPQNFIGEVDRFLSLEQRSAQPQIRHADAAAQARPDRPKLATVLVVDDSATNLDLIYQTLTPSGYRVLIVATVPDAISLAEQMLPDLILSDVHMPDADGFSLLRRLKAHAGLARIPIILITSSVWGEHACQAALQLGAARFLMRPIEPQQLIEEVAACLADQGARTDVTDPGR